MQTRKLAMRPVAAVYDRRKMTGRPSAVIDRRYRADQAAMLEKENLDRRKSGKQPALMKALNRFADPVYCIMRLLVGLMFACHGAQLVLGKFGGMPGSDQPMMVVGGWIQLIGGLLIALGLLTRVSAFIASGAMAVAYFMIHVGNAPTPAAKLFPILNHGELAVLYCWVFLFIFFYGAGWLSLDAMIWRGTSTTTPGVQANLGSTLH